ncbi:MAG: N-6 DNA methylase [Cyclobacteriaceae bacterium]
MTPSAEKDLAKLDPWKGRLGLFPMPLFEHEFLTEKFIMLNGGASGDFCLDFSDYNDIDSIRSDAWSSDVAHYITLSGHDINLYRWDSYSPTRYQTASVERKLEDFYKFLRKQSVNRQDSIVKFGIALYRNIRAVMRDNEGNASLGVMLKMLTLFAERNSNDVDQTWVLPEGVDNNISGIREGDFQKLMEYLQTGLESRSLRPNISLLLRHAAGTIFQEAQFETLFPLQYQTAFEGFLPTTPTAPRQRQQTSAHYTPTSIVRTIVEEALRDFDLSKYTELTALDPACGSGEFLKEFLRQIRIKGYTGKINIVGWDISATAIDMARFILNYEARSYKASVNINVELRDALESGTAWTQRADIVLMNPPFISWELMNNTQRDGVKSILGKLMDKRPNSAGAFLLNAIISLNEGGRIGCVVPSSIFEADSFSMMRNEIAGNLKIDIIGRLGSFSLYADAIVDTGILVATKQSANTNHAQPLVLWSDVKTESNSTALRELRKIRSTSALPSTSDEGYSIYVNRNFKIAGNWTPIEVGSYELLSRLNHLKTVGELFDVYQGARTGMNSVFLVPQSYWNKLPKKERKYFRPAITNESLKWGQLSDSYFIFYPYGSVEINSEQELKQAVPTYFADYLKPNKTKLAERARKSTDDYWELSEHRAWQRDHRAKLVSTEFGKAGAFAFDQTGIYVAERSNAWFPKEGAWSDIGFAYVTVLTLPIINDLLQGLSKQIGGGQWYLSSKYINQMPIPDLFDPAFQEDLLEELIQVGRLLSEGEQIDQETLLRFTKVLYHS